MLIHIGHYTISREGRGNECQPGCTATERNAHGITMTIRTPLLTLLILAATLLLLAVISYLAAPQLLSWQAQRWLRQLDCQTSQASVERPQWDRLLIRELRLSQCPRLGLTALSVPRLELRFNLRQLLLQQRLISIRVDAVRAELNLDGAKSTDQQPLQPQALALPGHILTRLPLEHGRISIAELQLQLPQRRLLVSGELLLSPASLSGRLQLKGDQPPPLAIALDWHHDDRLELSVADGDTRLYHLQGQVQLRDDQLIAEAEDRANLSALQSWLRLHGLLGEAFDPLSVSGESHSQWHLQAPLRGLLEGDLQQLQLTQALDLQLQLNAENGALKELSGPVSTRLHWFADRLQWQLLPSTALDLELRPGVLPHPALSDRWQLSSKEFEGSFAWQPTLSLRGDAGQLLLSAAGKRALAIDTALSQFYWQPGQAYGRFDSAMERQALTLEALQLQQLQAHASGSLAIAEQLISLNVDPGSYLTAETLQRQALRVRQLKLVSHEPLQVRTAFGGSSWILGTLRVNLASSDIEARPAAGRGFTSDGFSGQLSVTLPQSTAGEASGELNVALHQPRWQQWSVPRLQLTMPYRLRYPELQAQPRLQADKLKLQINGEAKVDLRRQRLRSQWQLPSTPLTTLIGLLPAAQRQSLGELQIARGQLSAATLFNQQSGANGTVWKAEGDVGITGVDVNVYNWQVREARSALQFSAASGEKLNGHGALWVDHVDGALPIGDIHVAFSLNPDGSDSLRIHQARLKALGGGVESPAFSLRLPDFTGATRLRLYDLDLAQLLALQPQTDIQGSGRLGGMLPIELTGEGLHIHDGTVSALPPGGMLAYRPAAGGDGVAAGNYGLKIALQALSNFRYKSLELDVNYQPDGTLILDTALKGSNPDWQKGQPIDFNIRIEQDLLKLLQALTFSDTLSEDLDRKLQKRNK